MTQEKLKKLAKQHGTPLFVVDHNAIRKNYQQFKKYLRACRRITQ